MFSKLIIIVLFILFTVCFTIYVRYFQIKECTRAFSLPASLPKWNYWALIFGLISSAGLSILANFQETVMAVHLIGALLSLGGGTAYFWTQVRTKKSRIQSNNKNFLNFYCKIIKNL